MFDESDPTFLISQESMEHTILEADRHDHVFYNTLSYEHLTSV